jgi:large subunit ribosomal protein L17
MFRNLAIALLTHGRITTTLAKAKEIRGVVEPLIRRSQQDDLHSRREVYRILGDHQLVKRLFVEIGPLFKDMHKGGYTRVVSLALPRKGDNAPLAVVELLRGAHYDAPQGAPKTETNKDENAAQDKGGGKTAAKIKAPAKPKAVKGSAKGSQVMNAKPKSTPRKMEG